MGIAERREREREARRQAVLDAARALLLERGIAGTTTRLIAERCEFSEATLFFYFQNKDEILVSLQFEGIAFWSRGLARIEALAVAPEAKLARLWRYFGEVRSEHPEYFHLSAYLAQPHAAASVADEVKAELARRSGENFALLVRIVEQATGRANGRLAADLLWGAFLGLMVLRDSRTALGARAHPADGELGAVLRLLQSGLAPDTGKGGS